MALKQLFDAGHVVRTYRALETMLALQVSEWSLVERHQAGDFGDIGPSMREHNAAAIGSNGRVFSAYRIAPGAVVCVVTDLHWHMTTILMPGEFARRFPKDSSRETLRSADARA